MSILSRLFGGTAKREAGAELAEIYKGFRIIAAPQEERDGFRIGARIEQEMGGEVKAHHFLRADMLRDRATAEAFSIRKAKQAIDEQGERIFR